MRSRATLLPWIVAFKAVKAALLTTLGITLLFSIRNDPVDLIVRATQAVHLPLSSRPVDVALNLAFRATPRKELALALTAFAYALLMATEGIGLYLRKSWARWFTIVATGSLIPIEVYEIVRKLHPIRIVILFLNVAIVVYLFKRKEVFD